VEHLVEDVPSSSDKELWEIVRRKRPCLTQGNGDEEVMVEHKDPPAKRLATAKAVTAALNKGAERQRRGKEKKTTSLQIPTKQPKIQTEAFTTPKGKGQPRAREVGEGSKDSLTKNRFNLETPKDILKSAPSQPNGVYSALAERMAEDGDWADSLWDIRDRLVLVAIYGSKDLGRLEGKPPPKKSCPGCIQKGDKEGMS